MKVMKALVDALHNSEAPVLTQPQDDISVFCSSMESKLRQIEDPRVLLMLQNETAQACFQARMAAFMMDGVAGFQQQPATPYNQFLPGTSTMPSTSTMSDTGNMHFVRFLMIRHPRYSYLQNLLHIYSMYMTCQAYKTLGKGQNKRQR